MRTKRAFISFDYDNDDDLRVLLAGQAKHPDSPFEFSDWSVKAAMRGDWKAEVREKIRKVDLVIVVCGEKTHTATGVAIELDIARQEAKPYFLLHGRSARRCTPPTSANPKDKIYNWTWDNLKALVDGRR